MNETGDALERLTRAVDGLERALAKAVQGGSSPVAGDDQNRLAAENAELRAAAERDAELRQEATAAVKAALNDLRALMPEGRPHG